MKRSVNINTNVLNGFINQAISHNKYLEETEMWKKKRELDSESYKKRPDSSNKNTKLEESPEELPIKKTKKSEEIDDLEVLLALYRDSKNKPVEKWGHSGFDELYPDYQSTRMNLAEKTTKQNDSDYGKSDSSDESDSANDRSSKKKKKSKHRKSSSPGKHKKKHSKNKKKKKKKHKE